MSILIEKPGLLSTFQDLGRHRYRRFGINPNGVMDAAAARLINILVGNDETEAVLEMHFPGPRIVFLANAIAAIGGGDFEPELDRCRLVGCKPFFAKKGGTLTFSAKATGNRAYLAVRGGFKLREWLGSSSTNLTAGIGGFRGRKIESGDLIGLRQKIRSNINRSFNAVSRGLVPGYGSFPTVRILAGAEFDQLSPSGRDRLLNQNFRVSNDSNRMGFRLVGDPIALEKSHEFVSSAVGFGTVQLLPDGQLIVLMADHQTAGGYPRVAHVITCDLPLIAQLGSGDKVAFFLVSVEEAEKLILDFERELNFLRVACRFQSSTW